MASVRRFALLVVACGTALGWAGSALAAAPSSSALPQVVGRPQAGEYLAAGTGSWNNAPTGYAYQWLRCGITGSGCSDIAGATSQLYLVTSSDRGSTLAVEVTASNADGDGNAASAPSLPVVTASLGTDHFVVHYLTDPAYPGSITQTKAGDVAALAERARSAELGDHYPSPPSDGRGGDDRIDLYVADLGNTGLLGYAQPEATAAPAGGYVVLNGAVSEALEMQTVAHELFHLIQFGIWLPASLSDYWLLEGSAEWMGYRADDYDVGTLDIGGWDMSLDCRDPDGFSQCDLEDAYKNGGYSRWPFFEYVTARFGADFVKDVFGKGADGAGSATAAIAAAVGAEHAGFADVFTDWTIANMTGGYAVPALQTPTVPTEGDPLYAGSFTSLNAKTKPGAPKVGSGSIPSRTVSVNHLGARYLAIRRGSDTLPDTPCYQATLELRVDLPDGVGARPYFWWSEKDKDGKNKQPVQPLAIDDGVARISVPWDTCDWGSTQGYLVLPNSSTGRDGAIFKVSGTLRVDSSTQATAVLPPDPVALTGSTVDAPGSADAPRIEVFGPQLIRIQSGKRQLRVIVSSSGPGSLRASLGSLSLGTGRLRAGSNEMLFRLPQKALRSLRRTSAAPSVLTLTSLSTSGAAGERVKRRVSVQTARPVAKKKKTVARR